MGGGDPDSVNRRKCPRPLGNLWTPNIVSLVMTLVPCHVSSVWTKWFQTRASCSSPLWKRLKEIGSLRFKGQPHFPSTILKFMETLHLSWLLLVMNVGKMVDNHSVCIQLQNEWPAENPSRHLHLKKINPKKYLSCPATISNKCWPLFISEIIMLLCINY